MNKSTHANGDYGIDAPPVIRNLIIAGFLVDDIASARAEMESQGVEFIGPIETAEDGNAWSHIRAPDGFIYELTYSPNHPSR